MGHGVSSSQWLVSVRSLSVSFPCPYPWAQDFTLAHISAAFDTMLLVAKLLVMYSCERGPDVVIH